MSSCLLRLHVEDDQLAGGCGVANGAKVGHELGRHDHRTGRDHIADIDGEGDLHAAPKQSISPLIHSYGQQRSGRYLIAERCQADDVLVFGDYVNDSQIGIHGKLFERRITSMCRQSRPQLLENHQIPHLPDAPIHQFVF